MINILVAVKIWGQACSNNWNNCRINCDNLPVVQILADIVTEIYGY